jgi:ankyrin repeat protein
LYQAVVEMLLTVNANVNARDNMGRSALLEAAKASHDDILHLLLARGAKLGLDPAGQAQALCDAVARGDINMLSRLIKCGADANAVDYDRMTALHIAAAEGNLQAVSGCGGRGGGGGCRGVEPSGHVQTVSG